MAVYAAWKMGDNGYWRHKMLVGIYDPKDWRHDAIQEAAHYSRWMRTVYLITRHTDDEKQELLNGLNPIGDVLNTYGDVDVTHESSYRTGICLDEARIKDVSRDEHILDKGLGPLPVDLIDCTGASKIYISSVDVVRNGIIADSNVVTSGTYSVGTAKTYADFVTADADWTTLTGDLTFEQQTDTVESSLIDWNNGLIGAGNTLKITTDTDPLGVPSNGWLISINMNGSFMSDAGATGAGTFQYDKLHMQRIIEPPVANVYMISVRNTNVSSTVKVTNCMLDNGGLRGFGLSLDAAGGVAVVNNTIIWDLPKGTGNGILVNDASWKIQNCSIYNCRQGINANSLACIIENCVSFDNIVADFNLIGSATGNNNADTDGTGADGNWSAGADNNPSLIEADEVESIDPANSLFMYPKGDGTIYNSAKAPDHVNDIKNIPWASPYSIGVFQFLSAGIGRPLVNGGLVNRGLVNGGLIN